MGDESKEAQGARLRRARKLRYGTAREAAHALGLPEQTYAPYEQGKLHLGKRTPEFAAKFGVNVLWLQTNKGPMRPGDPHPVLQVFEQILPEKQPEALEMLEIFAARHRSKS